MNRADLREIAHDAADPQPTAKKFSRYARGRTPEPGSSCRLAI
jgi:hypothetical protein